MKFLPRAKNENLVVNMLLSETLVYDLETNQAYCLNETCAAVWLECDGTKTAAEIGAVLSAKLSSPVTEEIVLLALDALHQNGLMIDHARYPKMFSNVSRREAIRRAGLTTLIALPAIAFLVAPSAANAASSGCTSFGDFYSQCDVDGPRCCQSGFTCRPYLSFGNFCLPPA